MTKQCYFCKETYDAVDMYTYPDGVSMRCRQCTAGLTVGIAINESAERSQVEYMEAPSIEQAAAVKASSNGSRVGRLFHGMYPSGERWWIMLPLENPDEEAETDARRWRFVKSEGYLDDLPRREQTVTEMVDNEMKRKQK